MISDASVADVRAGVSALQHGVASDCIQRVLVVLSDVAAGGRIRIDVVGKQDGYAGGHPEFHGFVAAGEPRDCVGLSITAWPGRLEDFAGGRGGDTVGRIAGDEAADERDSPDLRRAGAHGIFPTAVARAPAAADHHGANPDGGDSGSIRASAAALADGGFMEERAGACGVGGVFPAGSDDAGAAGVNGDLFRGPAAGKEAEPRVAGSDDGDATVVGGERGIRILRAASAVQHRVRRVGGSDRVADLDADLGGDRVPGGGMERRTGGDEVRANEAKRLRGICGEVAREVQL